MERQKSKMDIDRLKLVEIYNSLNNFGRDNGMVIISLERGKVDYEMKIQEKHLATPIAAHGGILAGFMDAILGVTGLSVSAEQKKLVSTIEFKISYFKPALLNDVLIGKGVVENHGNRIISTSGEIFCPERDMIIAKGSGTFNAYPFEKAGIPLTIFDQ